MRFADQLSRRERETLDMVARLGRLRACLPALRRGIRLTLYVDEELYVFLRDNGDGNPAVVVINRGDDRQAVLVELPRGLAGPENYTDIFSGIETSVEDDVFGSFDVVNHSVLVFLASENSCSD